MKALKVIHLSFVGLWLGGNVSAVLLSLLAAWTPADATVGIYLALEFIDHWAIVPGAIGCSLTGIAYGLWTNWGFFKFRWITIKWVVMIIQMILGAGFLGRAVASNVRLLTTLSVAAVNDVTFGSNQMLIQVLGLIQGILLLFLIGISVYKPFKDARTR